MLCVVCVAMLILAIVHTFIINNSLLALMEWEKQSARRQEVSCEVSSGPQLLRTTARQSDTDTNKLQEFHGTCIKIILKQIHFHSQHSDALSVGIICICTHSVSISRKIE